MKKALFLVIAGIIGGNLSAHADVEQANKLTPLQKQRIAWALKILGETKTLTVKDNQDEQSDSLKLDQDILDILESEGLIERGEAQSSTICIGPSK